MYAKLMADGSIKAPYYLNDLQRDNPHTSFPDTLSPLVLEGFGVAIVSQTPPPEVDTSVNQLTYSVVRQEGQYKQVWSATPISEEIASQRVRDRRSDKLRATDWTQTPDATVDRAAWATYRQALRDVPQQPGFPYSIVWPNEPTGA